MGRCPSVRPICEIKCQGKDITALKPKKYYEFMSYSKIIFVGEKNRFLTVKLNCKTYAYQLIDSLKFKS